MMEHVHTFIEACRGATNLRVCVPGRYVPFFVSHMLPKVSAVIDVLFIARDDYNIHVEHPVIRQLIDCKQIRRIVAHHLMSHHPKIMWMPLGIGSSSWWTKSDAPRMDAPPLEQLLYVNFSIHSNPSHRSGVLSRLEASGFHMSPLVSKEAFVEKLRTSLFCASPDGKAKDCFRTWEAMAVGCTPLVDDWPALRRAAPWLPVVWIGCASDDESDVLAIASWSDVTETRLRAIQPRAQQRMKDAGTTFLSHKTWCEALQALCDDPVGCRPLVELVKPQKEEDATRAADASAA